MFLFFNCLFLSDFITHKLFFPSNISNVCVLISDISIYLQYIFNTAQQLMVQNEISGKHAPHCTWLHFPNSRAVSDFCHQLLYTSTDSTMYSNTPCISGSITEKKSPSIKKAYLLVSSYFYLLIQSPKYSNMNDCY